MNSEENRTNYTGILAEAAQVLEQKKIDDIINKMNSIFNTQVRLDKKNSKLILGFDKAVIFPDVVLSFEIIRNISKVHNKTYTIMEWLRKHEKYEYIEGILEYLQEITEEECQSKSVQETIWELEHIINQLQEDRKDEKDKDKEDKERRELIDLLYELIDRLRDAHVKTKTLGSFYAKRTTKKNDCRMQYQKICSGDCEENQIGTIVLYVKAIEESAMNHRIDFTSYVESVFAHELFHAIHYFCYMIEQMEMDKVPYCAWNYRRKVEDAKTVKECLATYFEYEWIKEMGKQGNLSATLLEDELLTKLNSGCDLLNPYSSALPFITRRRNDICRLFECSLFSWKESYEII